LNDTVHLLPPITQRGRRKKGCFNLNFCRPLSRLEPTDRTQWPTTHHAPARKPVRGGRALAVAPNGRPAGCSPCYTAKSHSLGSINNSQHSSNERGGKRTEEEEREGRDRTKEREGKKTKEEEERGENERERKRRTREEEGTPSRLLTAAPLPPSESQPPPPPAAPVPAPPPAAAATPASPPPPRHVTLLPPYSGFYLFFLLCMQNE